MRRHVGEQPLDVRSRMHKATFARALRGRPPGIEPVGRGDGEKADIAPVLGHQPDGGNRFRCNRAGVGNEDLTVRSRLAQPIAAIDDLLAQFLRHRARNLLDRPRR